MTRHLVHAIIGLAVFASPWIFGPPLIPYLVAGAFVITNGLAVRFGWLKSIHDDRWSSWGTVAYPLALIVILPFTWDEGGEKLYIMQTSFVVMALADPAAAIAGKTWDFGKGAQKYVSGKSFAGSIAFGVTAWFVSGLALTLCSLAGSIGFDEHWIWHIAAIIGICGAALEALGWRGWDNLIIVVGLAGLLLHLHGNEEAIRWLGWHTLIALGFGVGAYLLRVLDASGALAAGLMAESILVFAGPAWAAPPLAFFLLASALSIVANRFRRGEVIRQPRGSRRDAVQVLANGGVGWAVLLLHAARPDPVLFLIYAASFSAAAADTWATEIGTSVRGRTVSLVGFKSVPPGFSGGVSLAGTLASVAGAISVSVATLLVHDSIDPDWVGTGMVVVLSGLAGSTVDSLLGATLQGQYKAPDGTRTESTGGLTNPNELVRGYRWVNNDTVNAVCTLVGALIAFLILNSWR